MINVTQGKRSAVFTLIHPGHETEALRLISYRFRLVSISCDPNFTFSIDGHNMTVIEADGISTQPLLVDSIQIFAGKLLSLYVSTLFSTFQRSTLLLCRELITVYLINYASLLYSSRPINPSTTTVGLLPCHSYHSGSALIGIRSLPQRGTYADFTNLAVLRYDDASDTDPTVDPTINIPKSSLPLIENNLHVRKLTSIM